MFIHANNGNASDPSAALRFRDRKANQFAFGSFVFC
jgi:hypothetical protein